MTTREHDPDLVERACEVMHDAYEAAAVGAGWETQQASRKPWADVPNANRETMRAAVSALLDWLPDGGARAERDRVLAEVLDHIVQLDGVIPAVIYLDLIALVARLRGGEG